MTFLHLPHLNCQNFVMNLNATLILIQSTFQMCLLSGLSDGTLIHAFHRWPWITSQSQVCLFVQCHYLDLINMLATSVDVECCLAKGKFYCHISMLGFLFSHRMP